MSEFAPRATRGTPTRSFKGSSTLLTSDFRVSQRLIANCQRLTGLTYCRIPRRSPSASPKRRCDARAALLRKRRLSPALDPLPEQLSDERAGVHHQPQAASRLSARAAVSASSGDWPSSSRHGHFVLEFSLNHPPAKATSSYSGTTTLSTLALAAVALTKGRARPLTWKPWRYARRGVPSMPLSQPSYRLSNGVPRQSPPSQPVPGYLYSSPSGILTLPRYSTQHMSVTTFSPKLISKVYTLVKVFILSI